MHRIRRYILASLFLIVTTGMVQAQQKIAFIDLNRAFNEYAKTKTADAQLKERAEEFNEDRKNLLKDYETLQEDFKKLRDEAQNKIYNEEVRQEKRNLAEEKLVELREYESKIRSFDATRKKQLESQSRRMRQRIIAEINTVLQTYAKNQGFTAIFDCSGESLNQVPQVVYYDQNLDVTDDILEIMNTQEEE